MLFRGRKPRTQSTLSTGSRAHSTLCATRDRCQLAGAGRNGDRRETASQTGPPVSARTTAPQGCRQVSRAGRWSPTDQGSTLRRAGRYGRIRPTTRMRSDRGLRVADAEQVRGRTRIGKVALTSDRDDPSETGPTRRPWPPAGTTWAEAEDGLQRFTATRSTDAEAECPEGQGFAPTFPGRPDGRICQGPQGRRRNRREATCKALRPAAWVEHAADQGDAR